MWRAAQSRDGQGGGTSRSAPVAVPGPETGMERRLHNDVRALTLAYRVFSSLKRDVGTIDLRIPLRRSVVSIRHRDSGSVERGVR